MQIAIGLNNNELTDLRHRSITLYSSRNTVLQPFNPSVSIAGEIKPVGDALSIDPEEMLTIAAANGILSIKGHKYPTLEAGQALELMSQNGQAIFVITSLARQHGSGKSYPHYSGRLRIYPDRDSLRVNVICDLEDYVRGVIASEMPGYYELEAIKTQCVTARTYALHPRIDHAADRCNVCDSYLCCQYFIGNSDNLSPQYEYAIQQTKGQILEYQGKPILALFSACAGGYTENYENCFSDLHTDAFPGTPLPYLKAASESKSPGSFVGVDEKTMKALWHKKNVETYDSWSQSFKWLNIISADALESQMHHVIALMMNDAQFAPFLIPPPRQAFGHIHSFRVVRRGVSGVAMQLEIKTSTGIWTCKKELVIRSIFKNHDLHIARLNSARIYFEHDYDKAGILGQVKIFGFGKGHGVGMQQIGSQGMALSGKNYKEILSHYFKNTNLERL